ncbi:MAG: hypothetical protein ACK4KW_11295 [Gemmobacter sp.]
MSEIGRDSLLGQEVALARDERILAEFPADRGAYWRGHAKVAALGGVAAFGVLLAIGNPHPWVGPVAAVAAIAARAAFLASEALAERWLLTDRRLIGPGGRVVPLSTLQTVRPFFGDVQIVTRAGDKHLMKYQADPAALVAAIEDARR